MMQDGMTAFLNMVTGILSVEIVQQMFFFVMAGSAFGLFLKLVKFR